MCGGNLEVKEGMTVCECEYCGSIQTVPTLDVEKKITLFTRANRLRLACEFDKASGVYESIVTDFPEEAEAYWGLILCKYGIEYVDDPKTAKKIPTCHRSSFDSVMDDPNFELVMECSDPSSRSVYREEAKAIEKLRKGIIEVSSKEAPYDIFICYKETDAMGNRTIDSVIAQDVYDALTEKGYRVFFSRISLEDKLGQEYEPYIFAALNSAKIMLAFGTDYEYYNAVWVKNEWGRFLNLIAKGEKKTLIPCYKDIDAYDMPKEFARLQAQDMGKVGAVQDLVRGIGKILGINSSGSTQNSNASNNESANLVQRGNMALEDKDFENAEKYFERSLDLNPSNAYAYLGKFLATYQLTSLNDLKEKVVPIEENKEFRHAFQFADSQLEKALKNVQESNELKIARARFLDVIKKSREAITLKKKISPLTEGTEDGYRQCLAMIDSLYSYGLINDDECKKQKDIAEGQYIALKLLKSDFEMHSFMELSNEASHKGIVLRNSALEELVKAGFIEEHSNKYCWPNAEKEKEKRDKQQTAFNAACSLIEGEINKEVSEKSKSISEKYDSQIHEIQCEMEKKMAELNEQRDSMQRDINTMQEKLSKLGIFKRKEKKEIEAQIAEARSRMTLIEEKQDVQSRYNIQIDRVTKEKLDAIDSISKEIRARHPLPAFENFAEP